MTTTGRYFWLPVADDSSRYNLVQHAFPGRTSESGAAESAHCEKTFALATPSEVDWICAPTCQTCNEALKARKGWPGR